MMKGMFLRTKFSIACAYCAKSLNKEGMEVKVSCNGDLEVGGHYE